MEKVKFKKDFATKRIGDICEYDRQLAHQLVNVDEVAEYTTDGITEVDETRENIEVKSEVDYQPAKEGVNTTHEDEDDGMILNLDNIENDETQTENENPESTEAEEKTETEVEEAAELEKQAKTPKADKKK